ncbi:MAG TPA: hypothetical protein VEH84_12655, partial [Alphaproteobacteria bacterium]|nr:hypothetical protein [Alphaproteobacteria bacterium]
QATTGDRGSSTAGDRGQATAGASGRAVAGDRGQAVTGERGLTIAGNAGQAVSGDRGDAEAGEAGLAVAGYNGIAVAGARGQAVAGDEGEAEAGDEGYALAGLRGLAAVGAAGLAVAGIGGSARAGIGGVIAILHRAGGRLRLAVGHVGEDGLQPGRLYHLDEAGGFVPDDEAGVDETPLSRGGDGEEAEPIGALALDDDSARQVREVAETPDPGNAAFERVIPPREPPKPDHDDSTGGLTAARP